MKCENCVRPDPCGGKVNEDGECGLHRTAEEWRREHADTPETLDALVARMRRWAKEGVTLVSTGYIADRIEAAAERERED